MVRFEHRWVDAATLAASAACLVHCLALPLLVAALPLLSGLLDADETIHRLLLAFALPASALALSLGHRRHGRVLPPAGGAVALMLLASALFVEERAVETALTVAGSVLLASAHLMNWHLRPRLG
jgi:hypothetical protein